MEAECGDGSGRAGVPSRGSPWTRVLSAFARPLRRTSVFREGRSDRVGCAKGPCEFRSTPTPSRRGSADHSVSSGGFGTYRRCRLYPALAGVHEEKLPGYGAQDPKVLAELVTPGIGSLAYPKSSSLVADGGSQWMAVEESERDSVFTEDTRRSTLSLSGASGSSDKAVLGVLTTPFDFSPAYEGIPRWTRHGQRWKLLRIPTGGDHRRGRAAHDMRDRSSDSTPIVSLESESGVAVRSDVLLPSIQERVYVFDASLR